MLFTQGKTEIAPKEAGYNGRRLEVLNGHFQKLIDKGDVQCAAYCLSRGGKVFAHGAIGKKSFREDDSTPASPNCLQWIASITKTFTAVAIMKLVEDGLTRLDSKVGEILPQFDTPPYNQINLLHLLTHTSGMHADGGCFENKYQVGYWGLIEAAYKLRDKEKEFDWIAAALAAIGSGVRMKPGIEWAYCSFGYVVLGAVIEKLTGVHSHDYIIDNIAKPLGIDVFWPADTTPDRARRFLFTESSKAWLRDIIDGKTEEEPDVWDALKIPGTGGSLSGTVNDLVIFGNMMLHGGTFNGARILGRKAVERMTTLQTHNNPNYCWGAKEEPNRGYGVGFDMRDDMMNGPAYIFSKGTYMHEGSGACALYVDPKEELVAAWFVPFAKEGWVAPAMYNTVNIIWSGLL